MKIFPKDIYEKLEFDKILQITSAECLGKGGEEKVLKTHPAVDHNIINLKLDQVWEYIQSFDRNDPIPLHHYENIEEDLYLLTKEGYVLSIDAIKKIYHAISIGKSLQAYFESLQRRRLAPRLFKIFENGYVIDPKINDEIDRVIDEEGEVRPNASEALAKIYKKINSKEKEINAIYGKVIHQAKTNGLLADTVESFRNGRRVLTIPSENKRRVDGVIHDESATGKTVYLEPAEVIPLNNEIFNLYTERKKEIYKVLQDLCKSIRPHVGGLHTLYNCVVSLDEIRAKAKLARILDGKRPEVQDKPVFKILHGYNPVLKHKYDREDREVVPFDLELFNNNRILVISGPNAGGKSVSMKSTGLLQLMVQSGMCVPVDPNSVFGVYEKIFVDIGDQQSMEDDLSTYSSHLRNLKHFSENSNGKTLFLIDEFGSGTDPKIGGAIAESVLRKLHRSGAHGVVTTHYSNLKYFAFKTKGILNGSMEFDTANLQPTYQLKVGKPGSSFAYEIAQKIGLGMDIIKYAKHKTGQNEKAVDELLVKLQDEQKETQEKMAIMLEKEDRLNKLIKNYDQLHKELEFRRKKLKLSQKEQALFQLGEENRELQKLVRELKESKSLEKAKEAAVKYRIKKKEVVQEVVDLKEDVYYRDPIDDSKFVEGGYAKMRSGTQTGKIVKIKNGIAEMQMGFLTLNVPVKELVPAGAPVEVNSSVSIKTKLHGTREGVKTKLDIRGYTPTDAIQLVQELLDNALIHSISHLTIIHGKGNGVLRKVVHNKLKEYSEVKETSHPEEEYGGNGITYIKL